MSYKTQAFYIYRPSNRAGDLELRKLNFRSSSHAADVELHELMCSSAGLTLRPARVPGIIDTLSLKHALLNRKCWTYIMSFIGNIALFGFMLVEHNY